MTQHTPGPWAYGSNYIMAGEKIVVATRAEMKVANARLIAAAPEMLKALQEIAECNEECAQLPMSSDFKRWCVKTAVVARDAIAKAIGESNGSH